MNISKKLLIYFFIFTNYQFQAHYTEPVSLIYEITTRDELHGALQSKKPTTIKLYSQNCPYCNMFSKTFEASANKHGNINFLSANGKALNVPEVIAGFTKGNIKIPGYPSILFVKGGTIVDYQIGGDAKTFEEKLQKILK